MILVIDNYDSFTFNLVHYLQELGAAAEVFTLAAELGVNTANFEVVHSVEGDRGVLVMVVDATSVDVFRGGLIARGFKPAVTRNG